MTARCFLAFLIGIGLHGFAHAQSGWTPRKNVELVTGDSGGSQDRVMRLMLKIVQEKKILPVTSIVVNKGGAGGAVALVYLNQQPGDGHRILLVSPTFTTNHITGLSATGPADVTPLASLFSEQLGFYVKGNSPIKSGGDLVKRLKENPQSLSVAIGSNRGNLNHMSLVKVLRTAGMSDAEIQKLKALSFKGAESLPALLGGHIDVLVLTLSTVLPHIQSGEMRAIAIASPQRLPGPVARVPTWKEQGFDVVAGAWRIMLGPKGMDASQVAYWDDVLARVADDPEWKAELERSLWTPHFSGSAAAKTFLDAQYAEMKSLLSVLGAVKQ